MAELADAHGLGPCVFGRGGSTPSTRTISNGWLFCPSTDHSLLILFAVRRKANIMARIPVGSRVCAIQDGAGTQLNIFGYGEYIGDDVPGEEAAGFLADALRELGRTNPMIRLDNGDTVYGCECWWVTEETMREQYKDFTIVEVDIREARRKAKEE